MMRALVFWAILASFLGLMAVLARVGLLIHSRLCRIETRVASIDDVLKRRKEA